MTDRRQTDGRAIAYREHEREFTFAKNQLFFIDVTYDIHCVQKKTSPFVFSERELMFMFPICCRPSVCRLSSVTLVHPTQAVVIFRSISTAFGTLAVR